MVTGIQGSRWFTVTISGETAHAGTTPLGLRKDAMQDMVHAITALNELMLDPADELRFTIGRIAIEPNSSNSVANRATFSIDLRHPDAAVLRTRGDAIDTTVRDAVRHCTATVTETFHAQPIAFSPIVVDAVARAAETLGLRSIRLPSGAFHDAQLASGICPTGMIFVPCRGGISHNPAEYSTPEQLAAGTRVLTATLARVSRGLILSGHRNFVIPPGPSSIPPAPGENEPAPRFQRIGRKLACLHIQPRVACLDIGHGGPSIHAPANRRRA